jgi:hypothetical protein
MLSEPQIESVVDRPTQPGRKRWSDRKKVTRGQEGCCTERESEGLDLEGLRRRLAVCQRAGDTTMGMWRGAACVSGMRVKNVVELVR